MYTPSSPEEREFLAGYNPNKYKKPSVAVDTALYGYDPKEKKLKALLIRRGGFPYRGCWAFPGGFLNMEEHIHAAAARELQEETGISDVYADLYYVMGAPDRDPRDRVITPQYLSLVNLAAVSPRAGDDAAEAGWFALNGFAKKAARGERSVREEYEICLEGPERLELRVAQESHYAKTVQRRMEILESGDMAFDHAEVALRSLLHLRQELRYGDIAYNVFPEGATLAELQGLYEAAFLSPGDVEGNPLLQKQKDGRLTYFL